MKKHKSEKISLRELYSLIVEELIKLCDILVIKGYKCRKEEYESARYIVITDREDGIHEIKMKLFLLRCEVKIYQMWFKKDWTLSPILDKLAKSNLDGINNFLETLPL